ncbi:hypothetical protein ACF3NF_05035 [Anaerococcus martiniensis]|uniref:hypothetical protein n=1 Tax=Anaerococcus sp. WGS1579 TaxID=3366809 RepID=UPI00372D6FBE
MNKNSLEQMEFLTSAITSLLLAALTFLQYQKNRPYWWLILIVTILMGANAYTKYKKISPKN